jgi:hypothetical protein
MHHKQQPGGVPLAIGDTETTARALAFVHNGTWH